MFKYIYVYTNKICGRNEKGSNLPKDNKKYQYKTMCEINLLMLIPFYNEKYEKLKKCLVNFILKKMFNLTNKRFINGVL